MLDIGRKIIELRKRQGWSQGELAKAVGASRNIIGKYEMALKVAKVFDVPVDYLLGEGKHGL